MCELSDQIDAQALRLLELQLQIRSLEKREKRFVLQLARAQDLLINREGGWAKVKYREAKDADSATEKQ